MAKVVGKIIAGDFDNILVRQKAEETLELGELVIVPAKDKNILCQVYNLTYGSQLSQQHLELISGMKLESNSSLELFDEPLRNYTIASLKALITISKNGAVLSKSLPPFLSEVRSIEPEDLSFLTKPEHALRLGFLRSGSKKLPIDIFIDAELALSHHVLIPAQTGKGKSNLTKCLLWNNLEQPLAGILVLDPHDEYFGRSGLGLKDHTNSSRVSYYTSRSPPPGARTLRFNIKNLKPQHFTGVSSWTDAQLEALSTAYRSFGENWISQLMLADTLDKFHEGTLAVLKRRLSLLLDIQEHNGELICSGPFTFVGGEGTANSIIDSLEQCGIVIVDTATFTSGTEALIGTLLASEILHRYQRHNSEGELSSKPVISIVLEEAARVLGKESLSSGPNIFSTIAREGRKFKVGLFAITQIPSMIPREILANMGTKIILGLEMAQERSAIIDSAAQDLSSDERTIASLDKGEALVTSTFTKFPIPLSIPLFKELAANSIKPSKKIHVSEFS